MNARERMIAALELRETDRNPVCPVLSWDHALFVKGIKIEELETIGSAEASRIRLQAMADVGKQYGFDGLRVGLSELDGPYNGGTDFKIDALEDVEKIRIKTCEEYIRDGQTTTAQKVCEKNKTEYFITGMASGQSMNYLASVRGLQQGIIDIYDNPEMARAIMEKGCDISIEKGKALARAGVDCLYIGDASSSCSVISPGIFRDFCFPMYQKAVTAFRELGVKVYLHICGNADPLYEMIVETGVDATEPLDPLGGINIGNVKKRIGGKICLMGGVNTITLLHGSREQVVEETLSCMRQGGRTGYIVGAGDDIPRETPLGNIEAMVETVIRLNGN